MPSGKNHERINSFSLIVFFVFLTSILTTKFLGIESTICLLLFLFGFVLGTYYIGPDLDIKSRPYYRWKLFRFIWIPYQKVFPHRSFWTHSFVISDVIRIFYLFSLTLIPYSLFITMGNHDSRIVNHYILSLIKDYSYFPISLSMGLIFSSSLHTTADYLSSFFRKKKKKRRRKKQK